MKKPIEVLNITVHAAKINVFFNDSMKYLSPNRYLKLSMPLNFGKRNLFKFQSVKLSTNDARTGSMKKKPKIKIAGAAK